MANLGTTVKMTADSKRVLEPVKKTAFRSLKHAAFSVRKDAVASMIRARGPSRPGEPPHRHRGRLAGAIRVEGEKDDWVVGASYGRMESKDYPPWMARMHEFGGTFGVNRQGKTSLTKSGKRRKPAVYPARPFMAPALERAKERFQADWNAAAR